MINLKLKYIESKLRKVVESANLSPIEFESRLDDINVILELASKVTNDTLKDIVENFINDVKKQSLRNEALARFEEVLNRHNVKKSSTIQILEKRALAFVESGFLINHVESIFESEIIKMEEKLKVIEEDNNKAIAILENALNVLPKDMAFINKGQDNEQSIVDMLEHAKKILVFTTDYSIKEVQDLVAKYQKAQSELPLIVESEKTLMNRLNEALERNKASYIFKYLVSDNIKLEEIFKKMKNGEISTLCLDLLSNLTFEDVLLDDKILAAVLENKTEIIANHIYLYHGCSVYTVDDKLVKHPISYCLQPCILEYQDGKYVSNMLGSEYSFNYTLEEIENNYVSLITALKDAKRIMKKELYSSKLDLQYQVNPKTLSENFTPEIAKLFEDNFISLDNGRINIRQVNIPLVDGYYKTSEKWLSHDKVIEEFLNQNNIEIKRIGKNTSELSR